MKRFVLCTFLHLLALTPLGFAQEKQAGNHYLPGGGVADPADKVGFFPNTTGGIDALDLATGKLLWSSKSANRPLAASENRLFAQVGHAGEVRVVALDVSKDGKLALESDPIKLADWVSVRTAYGRSFASNARVEGDALLLSWEANAFYAGGARPPPEIEKAARKEASGFVRVDLKTGKIAALNKDQALKQFPIRTDSTSPKAGLLTLNIKDEPGNNPKNRFEKRRTLQAFNAAKEVVWEHAIEAPIFLIPRP